MASDHLADVEFRHLLSFRAVAQSGSFHEAAEMLEACRLAGVPLYVNELNGGENPIDDVCLCVWHLVEVVKRLGRELNNVQ